MRPFFAAVLFSVATLVFGAVYAADTEDLTSKMIGKWAFVMGSNTGDIEYTADGQMIFVGQGGPAPHFAMKGDEMTITFPNGGHARAKIVFVNVDEMHQTDLDKGFTIVMTRR